MKNTKEIINIKPIIGLYIGTNILDEINFKHKDKLITNVLQNIHIEHKTTFTEKTS